MAAVYVSNIVINSGADFSQVFQLESATTNSILDLSGYTIISQMRKHSGSSTAVNFTTSIVNANQGTIQIGLSTAITSTIKPGRYIYDIIALDGNTNSRTRVVEGMVLVREGATK